MSDVTKTALDNPRLNTVLSAVGALAAVLAVIGVLNGWLTSGSLNAKDITQLRENITALSVQVGNLSVKIEQGIRPDQLQTANGRIAGLEGRVTELDTRLRSDEERLRITEFVANINAESAKQAKH